MMEATQDAYVMNSGVYRIYCKETGKSYIGMSSGCDFRWLEHRNLLRKGHHSKYSLQRDWNLYGEDAFTFEILESVAIHSVPDYEHLRAREAVYIRQYSPFVYNIQHAKKKPVY